jgi:hypothetical protein
MQLHGRKRQLLCDLSVLDLACVLKAKTFHSLGQVRAAGNRASTAKRLELDIRDDATVEENASEKRDTKRSSLNMCRPGKKLTNFSSTRIWSFITSPQLECPKHHVRSLDSQVIDFAR